MNDPLSPLDVPPPRYLLESDSSDEEGEGQYPGSSSRLRQPTRARSVTINKKKGDEEVYDNAIVGTGQAGRYLARLSGLEKREEVLEILDDGRRIGRGWGYEGGISLDVEEGAVGSGWETSDIIMRGVKANRWTIISTYLPALYIPDPASKITRGTPPIRHLHIKGEDMKTDLGESYTSPNYISGLAGAFGASAAHPSSPLSSSSGVSIVLLPLPLSSIPIDAVSRALRHGGLEHAKLKAEQWDEDDDEAYVGPGMGKSEGQAIASRPGEESGGMYM